MVQSLKVFLWGEEIGRLAWENVVYPILCIIRFS